MPLDLPNRLALVCFKHFKGIHTCIEAKKNSISANLFLWILWLTQSLVTTIQKNLPVTGFPLASVTPTDWTVSVTGLPLAP